MTQPIRLIVLSVPHTITHPDWQACAFTGRVLKFLKMYAHDPNYEIIHIGHKDSIVPPTVKHYTVSTNETFLKAYGQEYLDGSWRTLGFAHYFKTDDPCYQEFHAQAIKVINDIKRPNDIICLTFGYGHKPIADAFPELISIETGIGYRDSFARYRIFESHAIMNASYGLNSVGRCDMDYYTRVIPNYFDDDDFEYSEVKDDYILYLGRIGMNKGVDIAIDATKRAKKRLIIAGQGSLLDAGYSYTPEHVELVGYADVQTRKQLMSKAQALFVASRYLEPFGGVQVEAWLSGTPTITSPWGAFAEYGNEQVGFQCWTMQDFVRALNQVHTLKPQDCRRHGYQFLMQNVKPKFDKYFQDIMNIYTGQGWYHGT